MTRWYLYEMFGGRRVDVRDDEEEAIALAHGVADSVPDEAGIAVIGIAIDPPHAIGDAGELGGVLHRVYSRDHVRRNIITES